jgi:ComF family protein
VKQSNKYSGNNSGNSSDTDWKRFLPSTNEIGRFCNWLAPVLCPICQKTQQDPSAIACNECVDSIQLNVAGCSICNDHIESGNICGRCISDPPQFDCLIAPWLYKTPLDILVRKAKFEHNYTLAWRLGRSAANYFLASYSGNYPQALVPVPLHVSRLRQRGYNQASLIANAISKLSGIKVYNDIAFKRHATHPQSKLAASERAVSLRAAFSTNKQPHIDHVAIVDDVATSGATLNELAKALKNVGYQQVDCWCIARSKKQ